MITNHKRVGKRLTRNTSRTEVTLPCRTRESMVHKPSPICKARTQNATDHTGFKCKSHIKHTTFTAHFSFDISYPQNVENQWKSRSYTFTRSWPPRDTFRRRQSLEYIRKAHRSLSLSPPLFLSLSLSPSLSFLFVFSLRSLLCFSFAYSCLSCPLCVKVCCSCVLS